MGQMLQSKKTKLQQKAALSASMPSIREKEEMFDFKGRRVQSFQTILQNFGVLREAELERGFLLHERGVMDVDGADDPHDSGKTMARSASAPTIKGGKRTRGEKMTGKTPLDERLPGSSVVKKAYVQRWGTEAVDRFRIFADVRGSFDTSKLIAPEKGVTYHCQLCKRPHTFNMDCRR